MLVRQFNSIKKITWQGLTFLGATGRGGSDVAFVLVFCVFVSHGQRPARIVGLPLVVGPSGFKEIVVINQNRPFKPYTTRLLWVGFYWRLFKAAFF